MLRLTIEVLEKFLGQPVGHSGDPLPEQRGSWAGHKGTWGALRLPYKQLRALGLTRETLGSTRPVHGLTTRALLLTIWDNLRGTRTAQVFLFT